jgi:hypothetical protein
LGSGRVWRETRLAKARLVALAVVSVGRPNFGPPPGKPGVLPQPALERGPGSRRPARARTPHAHTRKHYVLHAAPIAPRTSHQKHPKSPTREKKHPAKPGPKNNGIARVCRVPRDCPCVWTPLNTTRWTLPAGAFQSEAALTANCRLIGRCVSTCAMARPTAWASVPYAVKEPGSITTRRRLSGVAKETPEDRAVTQT